MVIDFYNRGGGGGGTADYATEAGSSKLLEGSNAFPDSANTGDVVAITESQAKKGGLRSVNLEAGVYQYDGADWNKIGEGEGGDSHTVIAVNNLNDGNLDAANCGDVRAKYVLHEITVGTGDTTPSSGETFPSDGSLAVKYVGEFDSIDGLRWKNGPDVWEMNVSGDGLTATLISGDGSRTASEVTATTTGTISGEDFLMEYKDGSDNTIIAFENAGKYWTCQSYSDSMQDYIFIDVPFEANWTGATVTTYKTAEGVWQYVEGEHKIGKFSPVTFESDEFEAFGFVYFGDFASSIEIYTARYSTQNTTKKSVVINTNGEVEVYDRNGILEQTISQGYTGDTTFNSYNHLYIYNDLANGYVGFEKGRLIRSRQIYDTVSASGWVNIEHNEPYPWIRNANANKGIVKVNQNGQVVEKYDVQVRTVKFNTTGYSAPSLVVRDTTGLPNNLFAPTTGGDAGQVLTSTGDSSEPTWATLIKSVKITSDAYDALVTKDPNTLYLIVDDE